MNNELWSKQGSNVREFITFSLVGASGFVVEFSLFNLFRFLGLPLLIAAGLAMPIAASSNWFLNRRFTFKSGASKKPAIQWGEYLAISAIGWGLNLAIFWVGYSLVKLYPNLAKVIATFLVWFWNYFANKFWTFKARD